MKTTSITRSATALAAATLILFGATACTNTESDTSSASEASTEVDGLGAGGNDLAAAVEADPAVEALVPSSFRDAGVIKLVTDPTYAPIDFTDEAGTIVGLEPDIALAVANKMGMEIKTEKADFNGILAGLEAKRFDASFAAWSITPERVKVVDMVSFYAGGTAIMAKAGSEDQITKVEDLCGLTVAVQTGTTQALNVLPDFERTCADAGLEDIKDLVVPQQDSANQSVASGRADVMIADNALVAYYSQMQPDAFAAVTGILVEPSLMGVAMPKSEDNSLAEAFQAGFQSLIDDGTYLEILGAWNLADSAIEQSEINPIVE